jgi:hypothetical protein
VVAVDEGQADGAGALEEGGRVRSKSPIPISKCSWPSARRLAEAISARQRDVRCGATSNGWVRSH